MSVFHITVTGSSPPNPKGLGTFLLCSGLCHPMPGKHLLVSFYWDFHGTGGTATMRKPDIEKSSVDRKLEVML